MKTRTRVLAVVMTLAMILSSLVIVIPTSAATADATPWHLSEDVATEFAGGSGTAEDPYQIATAGQLAYLAKLAYDNATDASNDAKPYRQLAYVVTADIDATAHQWTAIGAINDNDFEGTFDGGNYTITTVLNNVSNAFYTTTLSHGGLFGRIQNATVKNVKLDFTFDYSNRAVMKTTNSWFGFFSCSIYDKCTVDNVHVNMHVTGEVKTSNMLVTGGMAGYFNGTTISADGSRISNCSVGGSLNVKTTSQIAFSSFFGAMSGGKNGVAYFDNLVVTTDITLTACGHQDLIGSFCGRAWSNAEGTYEVTNFVDASKITTTKATNYLHYGTLHSFPTGASKQNFVVDGLVAMQDLQLYASKPGGSGNKECVSNLMSGSKFTNTLPMEFNNIYTTNSALPDFYTQAGTITLDDGTTITGTNVAHNADFVNTAALDYVVDDEAGTITITLDKALYDVFDAIGNVVVGYGSKTTAEYTDNGDGTLSFVLGYAAGGAGFITVEQTYDVAGTDEETGEPITTAVATGTSFTLNDKWTTYAEPITKNSGNSTNNPYEITSEAELAYVAFQYYTNVNGGAPATVYYQLGDDLDLSHRNWVAIGSYNASAMQAADFRYGGSLYGNGYTINGLTITDRAHADDEPAALFGATKTNCPIVDLYMTNVSIKVTDSNAGDVASGIAAVVAFASGKTVLTNVHVDGVIEATVTAESIVGGLVAQQQNCSFDICTMSGSVKVIAAKGINGVPCAGGIVGNSLGYGVMENCVNFATVTVQANTSNAIAGGLIAKTTGTIGATVADKDANDYQIFNCVNAGDVVLLAGLSGKANNMRMGGIIGNAGRGANNGSIEIDGCVNLGQIDVKAIGFNAGGGSGASQIVGLSEIYAHENTNVTQTAGLVLQNCFGVPSATENNSMVVMPKTVSTGSGDNVVVHDTWLNGGAVEANGHQNVDSCSTLFEINTDGTTVSVSATALDILLNIGFEMTLTYGDDVITDTADAAVEGDNYVWTFDAAADADATLDLEYWAGDALVAATVSARKATWAGMLAADSFANDDAETEAIEIANAAELGYLAKLMNNPVTTAEYQTASFILAADIDLAGGEWTPIAASHVVAFAFKGVIDGNNKKIQNMTLTADTYAYAQAFIGRAEGDFAMSNVTFVDPVIKTAGTPVANTTIPAAVTAVAALYKGTLDNVDVTGLDLEVANKGMGYVAGLVGYLCNVEAIIRNTDIDGKIYGDYAEETYAETYAGLLARGREGAVENCVVDVDIDLDLTLNNEKGATIGGVVGFISANADSEVTTITDTVFKGSINVVADAEQKTNTVVAIGGLLGRMQEKGSLTANNNVVAGAMTITDVSEGNLNLIAPGAVGIVNIITHGTGDAATTPEIVADGNVIYTANKLAGLNISNTELSGFTAWDLATNELVELRIDSANLGNSGLRFTSSMNADLYAAAMADANVKIVEFGTIIAPLALMANGVENLPAKVVVPYLVADYANAGKGVEGFVDVADGKNVFTGAIINIKEQNYDLAFAAASYITLEVYGETITIYGDATTQGRTVRQIAQAAIEDPDNGLTADQIALLQNYLA